VGELIKKLFRDGIHHQCGLTIDGLRASVSQASMVTGKDVARAQNIFPAPPLVHPEQSSKVRRVHSAL
jgi:hypothetical protein